MSIVIKDKDQYNDLFELNHKGSNFPIAYSFTNLIKNKISHLNRNPYVLVIMLNTGAYLNNKNQKTFANNELNSANSILSSLLLLIERIINDNKSNKVYDHILIYGFDSSCYLISTQGDFNKDKVFSQIRKELERVALSSETNIVNSLNSLLLSLDGQYNNFFNKQLRTSKLI